MAHGVRRRGVRVGIPVGAALVAVAAAALTPSLASAQTESLTPVSPQELVAAVLGARPQSFSGTLQITSNLLGPAASLLSGVQGSSSTNAVAIPEGTASVRLWRGVGEGLRVEVLNAQSERDLYASRTGVWLWNSSGEQAMHLVASGSAPSSMSSAAQSTFDPTTAADTIVAALGTDSTVRLGHNTYVAGQPVYTLVIQPTQAGSTIGRVSFWVDAANDQVLGMAIQGADGTTDLSWQFTQISFGSLPASTFTFTPPAGATVRQESVALSPTGCMVPLQSSSVTPTASGWTGYAPGTCAVNVAGATTLGSGWDRVAVLPKGALGAPTSTSAGSSSFGSTLRTLEQPVTLADGAHAMLLQTALVNALQLPSGQVLVGAVTPAILESDATVVIGG
ncbi:hypothetical protein Afer_1207 [Acidimicrobium ferrooxidans DSM 10331]|uniref:DUF2092 domain-containing protein n=1 Tax=Acidimicrobium ferrooxidans (strain DSM 10331 / JCM 15462 / NBRC 103882 / ICP) TaxID=525909 RepID=C7LZI1_ACIFD|nr:hypothetical protein [Acidimicrobium ferrooxidans]ACU54139.1 hypothetical protein Afer_1207 [Acidimicrobium ferrooxidans DSM 10331]